MYAVNNCSTLAGEGTFMVSGCLTALVAIKIGDTLPPVVMIPLLLCVGALGRNHFKRDPGFTGHQSSMPTSSLYP